MSDKEKKDVEFDVDAALFKILFIINAWDEQLSSALEQLDVTTINSLVKLGESTYQFIEFVTNLKWDEFNSYTSMKEFCDAFDALRGLSLPPPTAPLPPVFHYGNPWGGPAPIPGFFGSAVMMGGAPLPGAMMGGAPLPMMGAPIPCCAPPPMGAPMPCAAPLPGGAPLSSAAPLPDQKMGFSVGGAKDINTFRALIEQNKVPQLNAITCEGLFYDYYFDTTTNAMADHDDDEKQSDTKPLFYPSYSLALSAIPDSLLMMHSTHITKKVKDMIDDGDALDVYDFHIDTASANECFLTVGLNSNMTVRDFARKKLNLVVCLDISGSMGMSFGESYSQRSDSKMKVANECILGLLTHLKYDDRFGMVLFDHKAQVFIEFKEMKDHKMSDIVRIKDIADSGGTNFEVGYNKAMEMFNALDKFHFDMETHENRLIFLTDAHPNIGKTDPNSLLNLVEKAATNKTADRRVYTTFVGVGLDFNADLVNEITKVRGANYFAVHSKKEFIKRLHLEFEYFVSPMVFDLQLRLQSEGGGVCIEAVYGSNNINSSNGEVMNINTLFPSPPNDSGDIKGGIVIIKLKRNQKSNGYDNVNIECGFEDKFGKKFNTTQHVQIASMKQKEEIFPNLGVRKAVLLTRYVMIIKTWIKETQRSGSGSGFEQWKQIFHSFLTYFEGEMKIIKDDTLSQEMNILSKLIEYY